MVQNAAQDNNVSLNLILTALLCPKIRNGEEKLGYTKQKRDVKLIVSVSH